MEVDAKQETPTATEEKPQPKEEVTSPDSTQVKDESKEAPESVAPSEAKTDEKNEEPSANKVEETDKLKEEEKQESADKGDATEAAPSESKEEKPTEGGESEEQSSSDTETKKKKGRKTRQTPAKKPKTKPEVEQEVSYKGGDVVWVRITRLGWWPAIVVNKEDLPADFGAVHPSTLAVVKFFNEEEFEEVNKLDRLQPYNCEAKLNYIKAGMTKFLEFQKRGAKTSQYVNFPVSVEEAEKLTEGDVTLAEPDKYDTKKETPLKPPRGRKRRQAAEENEESDDQASSEPKNGERGKKNGKKSKRDSSLSLSEDDNTDSLNKDPETLERISKVVKEIVEVFITSDECLEYLKTRVAEEKPCERYVVFSEDRRHLSLQMSTVGFFEGLFHHYSKVADFLTVNWRKVKTLDKNLHERNFILNVLLPEAVSYGISKKFNLSHDEAEHYTIFGITELIDKKSVAGEAS